MRIFPHGNIINFEASIREMTAPELERLMQNFISRNTPVMTGLLDMSDQAVYVYGNTETITLDEESDRVEMIACSEEGENRIVRPFSSLEISHETHFDIEDPDQGVIRFPVFYVSFSKGEKDTGEEETVFFAPKEIVSYPLDCVVEFWNQIGELGRDVQFHPGGCSISSDFRKSLKGK